MAMVVRNDESKSVARLTPFLIRQGKKGSNRMPAWLFLRCSGMACLLAFSGALQRTVISLSQF